MLTPVVHRNPCHGVKWGFIDNYGIQCDGSSKVAKVYEEEPSRQGRFVTGTESLIKSWSKRHGCGCVFYSASDQKYGLVIVLLTET
jgi:hypothetical protein